ncbi:WecB/TagA/CpsF family glycosyltransferase [Mucilaginibacter gotjawali]|uniref:N-acetylglucosaminyldiphosphoundecaprenol N-acetyl-beta-D-mannosaminyltransferase n=1 Tax=Mucilaginibacter gotjawali TaxID=1550579 RepID=A0A839S8S0_9SPHI|nr:WecB/TagA/CpsF family glycosyltransferase [Mucilaginibacter gotjawali]MBB3054375.1 N-acetylglucosaminyldiphosphoundecaprenol N-acetyl-beta-D-mannosaminyltransferase [Mucilaginibacter gotjawali]
MLNKKRILSIDVSWGKYEEFVSLILGLGRERKSSYVCIANAHMLVEAHRSKSFQRVINDAEIITPDGMPLAKSFKLLYGIEQVRVDGMGLLPLLIERSIKENHSVYFYGGSPELIEHAKFFLKENYPSLNIAGIYSPPFRYLTVAEKSAVVENINQSGANIVFVALGCPKQEWWMAEMKGRIQSVMIGIGGALPVFVGLQKRAPIWMQRNSLEWLFRLLLEPRRLFKRYLITNVVFLWLLFYEKIKFNSVEYRSAIEKMNDTNNKQEYKNVSIS